ncbi:MAG: glycohydrolase toxin TNT-related protein [Actinomycetota bacterium]|nr:glycohydrolase toxin TNT-related protein [Actinomycetota bacterium]
MAAHVPPGPNGVIVPAPTKWYLVQPFLQAIPTFGLLAGTAMTWPSGHSAMMGITAMQWRNFATGFALIEPQLTGIRTVVGAQSIPERAAMVAAVDELGAAVLSLTGAASTVAQTVSDFAGTVQDTQDAIRRLLDRLSISGLWDTVTGLLTGEGDDILREVARDVGTVLSNFQQQVKGIVGLLDELTILIGDAATAFQKWIRPVLVENFGDGVGNALADAVTRYTDLQVGALTGLIGTVSGTVALADPDTWQGMAELAMSVMQDPSSAPGVLANMGKEFVAWDKWSGDHPGRAAGEAAFNIGSLFVPGGALSKTGSVARGLSLSRRMLDEGRLPQLGEVGDWARVPGGGPRLPEVPPVRPGTAPPPGRPEVPSGRPPTPGAEGGSGQRAPVEQSGRGAGSAGVGAGDRSTPATNHVGGQVPPDTGSTPAPPPRDIGSSGGPNTQGNTDSGGSGVSGTHAPSDHAGTPVEPPRAGEIFPEANPYGTLTREQFDAQFVDENGQLRYPDADDPAKPYAVPGSVRTLGLEEMRLELDGEIVDRVGHPGGAWLAPDGTPYEGRALPPDSLEKDYFRYRVNVENPLPTGWAIEQSRAAPWFGHPGEGTQYRIIAPEGTRPSVLKLIQFGFLEEI